MAISKNHKNGLTKRTGSDYAHFRRELWGLQCCCCVKCGRHTDLTLPYEYANSFHVHHKDGRGLGGAKRDDTFEACKGLCGSCHRREHHQ